MTAAAGPISCAKECTPVHLVVMQHGLWGNSTNLEPLEQMLQEHCNTSLAASSLPVRTVNSPVNNEKLTYDGVHTCGLRLVQLIRDTAEALQQEGFRVAQLSFVGYSLGGLMARYAVGVLQHEGAFDGPNAYQPLNFVTISTPHLGAWRFSEQASWPVRAWNSMFHGMVPVIASMTGHQLMLKDAHAWDQPLLMLMSDPDLPFYQGLQRFQKLFLLANTHHDRMVPYRTAAICHENPYEGRHTAPAHGDQHPSVVRPCDDNEEVQKRALGGVWFPIAFFTLLPLLLPVILVVLAVMSWQGRMHYAGILRQGITHTWLLKAAASPGFRSTAALDLEEGSGSDTGSPEGCTTGCGEECTAACADAQSVLLEDCSKGVAGSLTPCTGSTILDKQQWMIVRLNALPWERVDVDVRHGHAHAAIVLRNPKRFKNKDHLQYLFSRMQW